MAFLRSGETQFGFIRGLGTREALFSLKLLVQKCYDQQQDDFLWFIDYQSHDLLLARLREIGIDEKDIQIIKQLYWNFQLLSNVPIAKSKFFFRLFDVKFLNCNNNKLKVCSP